MKKTTYFIFIAAFALFAIAMHRTALSQDNEQVSIAHKNGWNLQWSDEFVPPDGMEVADPNASEWDVEHGNWDRRDNVKIVKKENSTDGYISLYMGKKTAPNGNEWSRYTLHSERYFAPPKGGEARIEIKFKGIDAKKQGMMINGAFQAFWLFSESTAVPGTDIKNMRGEIDMLEHAAYSGGKPMKNCVHITEFLGDRWGQGEKRKSSDWELVPTGKGEKGYYDDIEWHILAAEWSHERVSIYLDGKLLNDRYNKPGENGLKGTNYHNQPFIARYFPFDENFPLKLHIWGRVCHAGDRCPIGPADDKPPGLDRFPLEVRFDYVRFYTKDPYNTISFCIAPTPPTIDGIEDNSWEFLLADTLKHNIHGTPASENDLSTIYKAKWDNQSLYVLVDVKDDTLIHDSGNQPWEDDAVEIYIDGNNDKDGSYDSHNYRYIFRLNNDTVYAYQDTALIVDPEGITFAQNRTKTGYMMEIKMDWSAIGVSPSKGRLVRFDMFVNDDDTGGSRDKKIAWSSTSGQQTGLDKSRYGIILLENYICGAAKITAHPKEHSTDFLSHADFMIQAIHADHFQWQLNQNSGFTDISNNDTYSGVNTDTLKIRSIPFDMTGYQYRCIVRNSLGTDTSQAAALIVKDKESPVILSNHDDQILEAKSECQVTLPDYTVDVTATDNSDDNLKITQIPKPGSAVSMSNIEVTLTVADDFNNTAKKTFMVHAVDQTPPMIASTHIDQIIEVDKDCQTTLPNYISTVVATDNCFRMNELSVTQTPEPYTNVSDTTMEIILTVTDPEGNSSQVSFNVHFADEFNPKITCPGNQEFDLEQGQTTYTVAGTEFDPISTDDNCYIDSIINNYTNTSSLGGAEFPTDSTTVVWTVTDKAKNKARCSFDVVVKGASGIETLKQRGIKLYPNPTQGMLYYESNKALIHKIRVLDMTGNMIFELRDPDVNGTIDFSYLTSGIYFIQLSTGEDIWTSKIIRE